MESTITIFTFLGWSSPLDWFNPFPFPPASTPPTASDPWGAPAAPTDTASTDDPWGDGGASTTTDTMNSDPWGAPSNGTGNIL